MIILINCACISLPVNEDFKLPIEVRRGLVVSLSGLAVIASCSLHHFDKFPAGCHLWRLEMVLLV